MRRRLSAEERARIASDYGAAVPEGVAVTLCPRGWAFAAPPEVQHLSARTTAQAERRARYVALLRRLIAEGLSVEGIAARLDRGVPSVRRDLHRLDLIEEWREAQTCRA